MSPDSSHLGSVRSAAVVNREIRALFTRAGKGGRLYGEDRAEYDRLIAEWTIATATKARPEVVEAA